MAGHVLLQHAARLGGKLSSQVRAASADQPDQSKGWELRSLANRLLLWPPAESLLQLLRMRKVSAARPSLPATTPIPNCASQWSPSPRLSPTWSWPPQPGFTARPALLPV